MSHHGNFLLINIPKLLGDSMSLPEYPHTEHLMSYSHRSQRCGVFLLNMHKICILHHEPI